MTDPDDSDSMLFMIPNPFEPFPRIETPRLVLRAPTLDDVEVMFQIASDPRVARYGAPAPATREATRARLEKNLEALRTGASIRWMMIARDGGEYLGSVCLWAWDQAHFRAEVGYELAPSHWGRGLVVEAMTPVIRFGWEQMKLHSLEGKVHPDNQGSIRVLEKLGFEKEGYFRENYFNGQGFEDTAVYSLLAPSRP
jgi:ribosomal-protein-alanine N-acetyltransferase